MAQKRPFTSDPILTAVAIAYSNRSMIADLVMPRTAPLAKAAFKYKVHNLEDGFTIPDTKVGRRGRVNEVETSSVDVDSSTEDYGLEDPIPQSDIDNAPDGNQVVSKSTEFTRNLILLDREKRVSDLVFSAANYGANNSEVISAGDRFDDDANPIIMINDALATPLMRPTVMTFGEEAWNKFSVNPWVVKAAHGNSGDAGIASVEAVRKLFRLDKLLIGQARVNTARKGQDPDIKTAWGNSVSMTYQDPMADTRNGTTWGFTAQHGTPFAAQWFDKDIGLKGGQRVRVGESVKELVSAKDLGYLLENVTNA